MIIKKMFRHKIFNTKESSFMYEKLRKELLDVFEYWENEVQCEDVMGFSNYTLKDLIMKMDSFKLYRYTPSDYYGIRNIETQRIYLSNNGVMNDVFEGLPRILDNLSYQKVKTLYDLVKMKCFSETKDNVLMWSHYADSSKGICVEYDFSYLKRDELNILGHLFPVLYTEERGIDKDIREIIESHKSLNEAIFQDAVYEEDDNYNNILPLFLAKGKAWEYEKEWRILYTKQQLYENNMLGNSNIDLKCISAVYLGYRIDDEKREHIVEICKRLGKMNKPVSVYQAKLNCCKYEFVFDKIL